MWPTIWDPVNGTVPTLSVTLWWRNCRHTWHRWHLYDVTITECLFGRPPFTSKSVRELEDRIYDTTPVEVIDWLINWFKYLVNSYNLFVILWVTLVRCCDCSLVLTSVCLFLSITPALTHLLLYIIIIIIITAMIWWIFSPISSSLSHQY